MDICTLIIVAVTGATPPCHTVRACEDWNGKRYCTSSPVPCAQPQPYWSCERPDGSEYTEPWSAGPNTERR
jgi:hypothetical protein